MKIKRITKINIFVLLLVLSVLTLVLSFKNTAYAEESKETEETTENEKSKEEKDTKETKNDGFEFNGAKLKFITGNFDGKDSLDIDFPIEIKDANAEYIDEKAKIINTEKKAFTLKNPNILVLNNGEKYHVITAINAYKDVQDNIIDKVNIDSEILYDKSKLQIKLKLKDIKDEQKNIKYSICYASMDEKAFQTPEAFKLVDSKFRIPKHCNTVLRNSKF